MLSMRDTLLFPSRLVENPRGMMRKMPFMADLENPRGPNSLDIMMRGPAIPSRTANTATLV
jgi:hypothetical protein